MEEHVVVATTGADDSLSRVLAVINGKGGVGKCAAKFETIHDPVTGLPLTIEEAVHSRLRQVRSYTSAGRLVANFVRDWVDSGVKPVVRIELASGRTITVTPQHPMLMPDGWRRADQIKPGETVAAAGRYTDPWEDRGMNDRELDLLAVLLAEGNTSTAVTYFSTTDPDILDLAVAGAEVLGATVKVHREGLGYRIAGGHPSAVEPGRCECGCGEPLPLPTAAAPPGGTAVATRRFIRYHGTRTRSRLIDFRIQHGLDFVLAKHKTMPKAIYRLHRTQLGRFIAVFWMCDGYISPTGKPELILASETLVREFQHLLLRFGIQSQVSYKEAKFDGKIFDAWRLTVYASSIPRFEENIPLWGRKRARLAERAARLRATGGNTNVGSPSLTPELWERIRSYAPKPGRKPPGAPRLLDVAERLGWTFASKVPLRELLTNESSNGLRYISQRALAAYIDAFGGYKELGHLVSDQLFWDRVVRVVDAGEEHVYDLSVPGPANFVANDLIVHNTSLTANMSGQLARAGYRILAADLDLSGNLALDLGYVGHQLDDEGKGLVDAVWQDGNIPVIAGVRENLDVVPGGRHLELLTALAHTPMSGELAGGGVPQAFAAKLADLAADYDLVLLDCAPGNPVLQDMALVATRYILIPTKTDAAGWDGLRMVGPRVKKARALNPALTYLGVVLFAHQTTASRVLANTRARLEEVGDLVPLFDAYIRHSETAAHDCRSRGQLAHELARDASANTKERLQLLRTRRDGNVIELPAALSGTADSLAGDYAQLAREVLVRISAAEQAASLSTVVR